MGPSVLDDEVGDWVVALRLPGEGVPGALAAIGTTGDLWGLW